MKITTILGSPRKKGNTAKVLGFFEEKMAESHDINRINITDYEVSGCLGCGACQKVSDEPGCIQKDDAISLFNHMIQSDVMVYGTPLYAWSFSAQIKPLIDRHFCLVKGQGTAEYKSLIQGKPTALLVTCGGPIENNADIIQEIFERVNNYSKSRVIGKYVVPFCTTPDNIGEDAMNIAEKMAREIEAVSG